MSNGWTEDPELARLRSSVSSDAQEKEQLQERANKDLDAFMVRYQSMISGGFAQAADVLRASGKYRDIRLEPVRPRFYQWEIRGVHRGEDEALLKLSLNTSFSEYRGAVHFEGKHAYVEDFSEHWFREILRERVRKLVA